MGDSESGSAPVTPARFIEPSFNVSYGAWINFVNRRPNSIAGKSRCKESAMTGDPEALAQWNDWLYYIAEKRVLGEL